MLSYIWAEEQNGLIGNRGHLPWHLPTEMKHFTELTTGHTIIMGRKTFQSFPKGPLPNRTNVILTHRPASEFPQGVQVVDQPATIHKLVRDAPDELFFVIGGVSLFEEFADSVDILYQTKIAHLYQGDLYMSALPWHEFALVSQKKVPASSNTPALTFNQFQRI